MKSPAHFATFCLLVNLVCLQVPAQAKPYFNTPNDGCPARQRDVVCPLVCVASTSTYDQCPQSGRTDCGEGEFYCPDLGSCFAGESFQAACSTANPCSCLGRGDLGVPCGASFTAQVSVSPGLDVAEFKKIVSDSCSTELGGFVSDPSTAFFHDCSDPPQLSSVAFLPAYILYFAFALALGVYTSHKCASEGSIDGSSHSIGGQSGYVASRFGSLMAHLTVAASAGLAIILIILVGDYYSERIFFDPDQRAWAFIFTWHVVTVWYLVLKLNSANLDQFFRIKAPLSEATYVSLMKRRESTHFLHREYLSVRFAEFLLFIQGRLLGDYETFMLPVHRTQEGTRYIVHNCERFSYHTESNAFELVKVEHDMVLAGRDNGLTSTEANNRLETVGPNFIQVPVPTWFNGVKQEFSGSFYFYQIMCLFVWYYFAYWRMALVITCVVLLSASIKVVVNITSQRRVKQMAEYDAACQMKRDGKWETFSTQSIVPGDLVRIVPSEVVPCDCVLIAGSGDVILDESNLTGESTPVQKFSAYDNSKLHEKKHRLYAGTKVLDAPKDSIALVTSTGIQTSKGQLVANILFPSPIVFIFDLELVNVMFILAVWGLVTAILAVNLIGAGNVYAWFYAIFTISQIISPLLPAFLVVGQTVASRRLSYSGIFCVNLPRINLAGKVRVFCFDKTGTITKDGLEWYGFHNVNHQKRIFGSVQDSVDELDTLVQYGLASAHTVGKLGETLVGNPVDVEMFNATGWELGGDDRGVTVASRSSGVVLSVLKSFPFEHSLMQMSVCVRDSNDKKIRVFAKGSFETIRSICKPETIPNDFDQTTAAHTKEGCYTLALAYKSLDDSVFDVYSLDREFFEKDLVFLGLILFQNKMKHDSPEAIARLKAGSVRTVMITGDTALTGIHIAQLSGMTNPRSQIYLGDVDNGQLVWTNTETMEPADNIESLLSANADPESPRVVGDWVQLMGMKDSGKAATDVRSDSVELALTGAAFALLSQRGAIREYLLHTRVFARMTPFQKVECVELHMENFVTAMVGDGGNDCGALRAAHVGLALSDAEASIVSPFSSKFRSINSCVSLLREGRAALATSFACYKYIVVYGEIIVLSKLISYYFATLPSELVWIFLDSFLMVGLAFTLTQARPHPLLARTRPTARLLGPETLLSTTFAILINVIFLLSSVGWFFADPFFRCREFESNLVSVDKWWLLGDNYESVIIGSLVLFQLMFAGFVFNFGYLYRESWYRNYPFVSLFLVFFVILSYALLADPNPLGCAFRWNCGDSDELSALGYSYTGNHEEYNNPDAHNVMPPSQRWKLYFLLLGNFACQILVQGLGILRGRKHFQSRSRAIRITE